MAHTQVRIRKLNYRYVRVRRRAQGELQPDYITFRVVGSLPKEKMRLQRCLIPACPNPAVSRGRCESHRLAGISILTRLG